MASSTAVVSTPSIGMEKMLPDAIVCSNSKEIKDAIKYLLNEDIDRMKIGHLGLRNVINNHTYYHRMGEILDFMGIKDSESNSNDNRPLVSIVCCTNRPKMVENILKNYQNQKYKNLEMIVMLQAPKKDFLSLKRKLEKKRGVYVKRQLIKDSLGTTFNKGLEFCKGEYIAKFDDDDLYGPDYLTDTIDAFNYTDADIVGKYGVFIFDEKTNTFFFRDRGINRYLQIVMGATIVAKKSVFKEVKFPDRTTGEDTGFLKKCLEKKFKIYSSNPFNWVLVRKAEEGFHTWDDEGLLVSGSKKLPKVDLEDIFI
jgi:cellulose synthase/poly-beta-1,6-N-acetylglucosamine synthase-like glycosyltransferase